ncbi:metallophosphoesterase [Roseivirga sp.]|uniref:metallophosphoesterase n=1 Tax=Roseivirga sp. TaxID=1964215 RepID=UPI003B526EA6
MKKLISLLFTLLPLTGLAFQSQTPVYSVYLVGDAGEPYENPVLTLLKKELDAAGKNAAVIFLGDNIYPKGMPPEEHPLREAAEIAIDGQINAVKDFEGKRIFVPGNHDWAQGKEYGLEWLKNQQKYVEQALDDREVWLPSNGCPGPVEVDLTDQITLVIIDTQWFLHKGKKPEEGNDCGASTIAEVGELFQDILKRNAHKKVIVASHHPMYTYGIHGGVFSAKDHLFPLTASKKMKNLYVPLPVVGSIYPLYRKIFGNIQDTSHPVYKQFRDGMVQLMKSHPDIVHAAGHEHALEHIQKEGKHYIVSGSGSKNNAHVKQKGDALFAQNTMGFARLDYFEDGRVVLNFVTPENGQPKALYTSTISELPWQPGPKELLADFDPNTFKDKDTTFAASQKYHNRSKFHEALFGANYREEWAAEVELPIFDIASVEGGLKILKKGGGHQTTSLRLEGKDGKQYVLRSMDKNPALTLPPELRRTFIKSIVQDGISSSHPYAPVVIPSLADAAGIYHANPVIYFIPDDPRFGIYREDFANTVAVFEERANDEQIVEPFFGAGDDVESSIDLYDELEDDNDEKVDQVFVVRNRLFDMWLGDWDRHDDQWRWVEYDLKDDKKLYRPIPRDRDVAFFAGEGVFKKIAASKWAQPALKGFHDEITYTPSYGFYRIRWFDRYFMTEPSEADWVRQAQELKAALTDEVIESAFEVWPQKIFDLHGEEIIRKLKNRRDKLDIYASDYYRFLSKSVNVLGSDKREWFVVKRLNDEETDVTVYKISDKGNRDEVIYHRVFKTEETEEIRLFGFGQEDEFEVSGDVNKGIIVRIIGGGSKDLIVDKSSVKGLKKHTVVYDKAKSTTLEAGSETKSFITDKDPDINHYNMEEFDFDLRMPLVSFNFNPDDGIFLGGGFLKVTDGFRKEPYASKQSLVANYAIATSSYSIDYSAEFVDAIGKANLLIDAEIKAPNFVNNFFGLGNETEYNDDLELTYYRTRYQSYLLNPALSFQVGSKASFKIGGRLWDVEIEENEGRFISDFANNGLNPNILNEHRTYAGTNIAFQFDSKDDGVVAKRGVTFNTQLIYDIGINSISNNSARWNSDLTFRWILDGFGRTSMATRVGYNKSFGDFEFFQASYLDGFNTLRGYRRYRFAGESSFFHQIDLRVDLFEWRNYFLPSRVGLILFNDIGRVWVEGEDSNKLHHGYGGGIYLTPFGKVALNILLAKSEENFLPLFKLGFYF